MKEKIIDESLHSLRQEGLRFSIDILAEKLKVSKKTIYKYFSTKEELAYAMYEKYYRELTKKITDVIYNNIPSKEEELLLCYFDSAGMVCTEIFNKYSLNRSVGSYALQQHRKIWNLIVPYLCENMSQDETETYKLIVDGSYDKTISCHGDAIKVIGMLRRIK